MRCSNCSHQYDSAKDAHYETDTGEDIEVRCVRCRESFGAVPNPTHPDTEEDWNEFKERVEQLLSTD